MLLENARIGTPCNVRWSGMVGDDRVRFCGECGKNVYNLSALPRAEAERLLVEREGAMCVRLYKRADGTVMTADCPVAVRRLRVRRVVAAAAGALGLGAAALAGSNAGFRRNAPPMEQSTLIVAAPEMAAPEVAPPEVAPPTKAEPPRPGVEQLPDLAQPPAPPPGPRPLGIASWRRGVRHMQGDVGFY